MTDNVRWWFEPYDPDLDDAPPGVDDDCDGTEAKESDDG